MEVASILVSVLAVVLSVIALVLGERRGSRLAAIEIARRQEELESRAEQKTASQRADLDCYLERGHRKWEFVLMNRGPAIARDVEMSASPDPIRFIDEPRTPILHPGQEYRVGMLMAFGAGGPPFDVALTWTDDGGSNAKSMRVS